MSESGWNRRRFVAAASVSAAAAGRAIGANDRLSVAIVGCGGRGLLKEVLGFSTATNSEVTVVCDTWRQQREKAAAAVAEANGRQPKTAVRYQDVLAMKDVDAVVIGTPDHQHCTMLRDSVRAGKDAYIEKPLAMNLKEALEAVDAVKQSGRIVQVGTQVRSFASSAAGRAFVRSGGLGSIFKIEQSRNAYRPYWHSYAQRPVEQADVDWESFLMHVKHRPWNADQYAGWYGYRDFSLGPQTGLLSHFIDLVHFVTGAKFPQKATAMGGTFRWKDARTAPDSFEALFEYEEGFLVRYNTSFGTSSNNFLKFFGTRGVMDATQWARPWVLAGQPGEPDSLPQGATIPEVGSTPHMKNWLECIRNRKEPNAPIEAGFQHAVACLMAEESWVRGCRVTFDPAKRKIMAG
ncbi:MAG: Gfo/Idh/MocA family oxidoreductase [Bryobacterales bacterium]|nr:Gfo/Idh/MocA family oxidoreductase [Bryobacterales bacterium]MEB2360080.1 Gfo/Idh/MocA family oxidoreductase [Bryobacterales bacterium]